MNLRAETDDLLDRIRSGNNIDPETVDTRVLENARKIVGANHAATIAELQELLLGIPVDSDDSDEISTEI